jgi:hypothetical protein
MMLFDSARVDDYSEEDKSNSSVDNSYFKMKDDAEESSCK